MFAGAEPVGEKIRAVAMTQARCRIVQGYFVLQAPGRFDEMLPFDHLPEEDMEVLCLGALSSVFNGLMHDLVMAEPGFQWLRIRCGSHRGVFVPKTYPAHDVQQNGHRVLAAGAGIRAVAGIADIAVGELQGDGVIAEAAVHLIDKRAFLPVGFLATIGAILIKLLAPGKNGSTVSHPVADEVLGQYQHEISPTIVSVYFLQFRPVKHVARKGTQYGTFISGQCSTVSPSAGSFFSLSEGVHIWRQESSAVCHSGLDPESRVLLGSRFRALAST